MVWFDVVDPTLEDLNTLQEEFNLHPLAIEDAVSAHQRPKIDPYGDYWFLVILAATLESETQVYLHEISIFAGQRFLVTVRHSPPYDLADVEARWRAHPEWLRRGGGYLLYTILDAVVDGYFPVMESVEERVDRLERVLFEHHDRENAILEDIFRLRQQLQDFRRAVIPMRDILNPIIRRDLKLFTDLDVEYYRDVYDHAVRVLDQLDMVRDLVGSALEIHLSVVANRQSEVSKQLTVIATIFLPLSFVVGFFGQNFNFMVTHITGAGQFFGFGLGLEIAIVVAMLALFRVRGWF